MKKINDTLKVNQSLSSDLSLAFDQALTDPDFKLLVSKLKLPREILMKYTSSLMDAKREYTNCLNCKNLMMCQNQIVGHAYLPAVNNNQITFEYKACRYREKELKQKQYQQNVFTFDVSDEIKNAKMKDIYKDDKKRFKTIKWLTTFIEQYKQDKTIKGLYLHGNFGTGKTYLIAAMFNELATLGYKSAIIFWPEYLRDLKTSLTTDFNSKYERVKKVPLLLIDDLGAENTTTWVRDEIFCPLIQYRMENHLPTFITSNLNMEELEQHFSLTKSDVDVVKARRISSRLKELTDDIEMISENLRK